MELARPIWLLLLVLIVPFVAVEQRSLRSLSIGRRVVTTTLRLAALVALVVALADPRLVRSVDRLAVAYLIDGSASVSPTSRDQAIDWVRRALEAKGPDDLASVIVFGEDALVERAPSVVRDLDSVTSEPNPDETNIAEALRVASGLLPADTGRKIVLLSDGRETIGDGVGEARLLAAAGIPVSVVPLQGEGQQETLVRALDGPSVIRDGEVYRVRVTVEASQEGRGRLHLLVNDQAVATQEVTLHPGANTFVLTHDPLPPGFHNIRVQLDADDDTVAENNEGVSYLVVTGQGRVLIVEGSSGEGQFLTEALRAGGLVVDVAAPTALPTNLTDFRGWDGIVLVNVPATRLTPTQMAGIRDAVQRLGTGLVVIGGDTSFGPGGYSRTPLADALPVQMERRSLRAQSQVALLLVIDTSGSMASGVGGISKIALARESAIQALNLLGDFDYAGVLAFEDKPTWVLPLGQLEDRDAVLRAIGRLQPGGGTAIFPALSEAERAMGSVDARVRHIILLSDGISPAGDYDSLTLRLRQQEITLSTIAVGLDADQALLRRLAEDGNGRFYEGTDPFDLPQLLVKETLEVARAAIVEEEIRPIVVGSSPVLEGIRPESLPLLRGYVATSAKPTAQVSLVSPESDPLLAEWQYGLGRVVAWTSDAKNRWAANWIEWPEAVAFWTKLVKQSLPSPQNQSLQTQVTVENNVARIVVDAVGDDQAYENFAPLEVELTGPDGTSRSTSLRQMAPGRYVAELPAAEPGAYLVRVQRADGAESSSVQTTGFGVGYPREYRQTGEDLQLLTRITQITGGAFLADPAESVRRDVRARAGAPIWQWLVALAAVLFLADVGVRRVRTSLTVARTAVSSLRARWAIVQTVRPVAVRLLAAKQRAPTTVSLADRLQAGAIGRRARPAPGRPASPPPTIGSSDRSRPTSGSPRPAPTAMRAPIRSSGGSATASRLLDAKRRAGRR